VKASGHVAFGWEQLERTMAEVTLRNVSKKYDEVEAVRNVNLEIPDKEFLVLVGPSGCGKSTTLRMIAGLEEASSGEIYIGSDIVNDVPPKDRDIAMVFQNYALYPHMTVFENMSFGLRLRRVPKREIRERVEHAARILDITDLLLRRPKQLSGGQRQRVAMGRAIVRNPKVFLFDEPLSNLDAKLRVQMRTEIKRVHQKVKTTTVYVTHDQVEAMTLADRVVVMNGGRVEQVGTPNDLYHRPRTRFVAGFIGSPTMNFLSCRLQQNGAGMSLRISDKLSFPVPEGRAARYKPLAGKELILGLRPEHITEPRGDVRDQAAEFSVPLDVVEPMGMETMVFSTVNGTEICGRVEPSSAKGPGESMRLYANLNHMHLIDPQTDVVL
jgi:multiple sugar transport system ATP-binding protein